MNINFKLFIGIIAELSANKKGDFTNATLEIKKYINGLERLAFIDIVKEVGMIPEQIDASSSAEKLFSKASDCVLARCFSELGMPSIAVNERGNSADIVAKSLHGYTLVADAKTFRLSRTAKNQKDFKISTLSNWRGSEHNYALLVAPYFQYPSTTSQIYSSALDSEVCLLSWEHILFLLENKIVETEAFSLEQIWKAPTRIVRDTRIAFADRMNCHLSVIDKMICDRISKPISEFQYKLNECRTSIELRGKFELSFLETTKKEVEKLTREEAIIELLKSRKIQERITTINKFISALVQE